MESKASFAPSKNRRLMALCFPGSSKISTWQSLGILNYLDRGRIGGICVTDQFGAGYLSVETAVRALEEGGSQGREELDVWYIDKEDLRRPEYEKLLYPVE